MWLKVLVSCVIGTTVSAFVSDDPLERVEVIEAVNSAHTSWTAGRNFHPSFTKAYIGQLLGAKRPKKEIYLAEYKPRYTSFRGRSLRKLPVNFDARRKWRFCKSLQTIKDQGRCGSCWAVASASVFSERLCIATGGSWNGQLSAQQLVSCFGLGSCKGGWPGTVFWQFQTKGVVTGGDFGSHQGCQPYLIPPCHPDPTHESYCGSGSPPPTPTCRNTCYNRDYGTHIRRDYHRVNSTFKIIEDVIATQREIFTNGPLVATFELYEDFFSYKSGVYRHITGSRPGLHAVEIIGWGEEAGSPYWLIKNSWGSEWGDRGTVKFLRGSNHCGIESDITGGLV